MQTDTQRKVCAAVVRNGEVIMQRTYHGVPMTQVVDAIETYIQAENLNAQHACYVRVWPAYA